MKQGRWFLVMMVVSAAAQAVQIGQYSVAFNRADGRSGPLGSDNGWSCHSYQSMHFVGGDRVDARGNASEQRRAESGPSGYSLLSGNGTQMNFSAEMEAVDRGRPAYLEVTQRCTKTELTLQTYYDYEEEEMRTRFVQNEASQSVTYRCGFPNLPARRGQKVKVACSSGDPNEHRGTNNLYGFPTWSPGFTWSQIGSGPLFHLANIPVDAEVSLDAMQETYTKEICSGTGKKRVVVRLTQGLEGRMGENDFEYTVSIDGGSPFVVKKSDGILHDDILVCTDKENVDVKVTAIEKDLFFNDKYEADGADTVTLPLTGRVNDAMLHMKRKRMFKTTKHDVKVTVFNQSTEEEGTTARPMLAERPAHY